MVANVISTLTHFFTHNRPLSTLLLVSVILFGLVAFFLTPKQYNPEIVRPAFLVELHYEDATAEEAVDRVAYELVSKLQVIPEIDDILIRVEEGSTIQATLIFAVGADATEAKIDVIAQLESHSYLASGQVRFPRIQEINPETIPVLQVAVSSETKTVEEVRETVAKWQSELLAISGVSEVTIAGADGQAVLVSIDPLALADRGLTPQAVHETIAHADQYDPQTSFSTEDYAIETALVQSVSDIQSIGQLYVTKDVQVEDVATVYKGYTEPRSYVLYADQQTMSQEIVMLAAAKQKGSNAPEVTKAVRAQVQKLAERDAMSVQVVGDDGKVAAAEIFGLTQNLLVSIGIIAITLLVFLSVRSAVVVLIAIPVTFLIVLGIGYIFDQTINRITLFALILSLGLLVDSAIVVVENIYAHLQKRYTNGATESLAVLATSAVREVGPGLVLSTITSVIVFIPMLFITGMMGPYMGPIAFFVPVALLVALLVAVILTPFIATYILRTDESKYIWQVWPAAGMQLLQTKYVQFLRWVAMKRKRQSWLLRSATLLFVVAVVLPMVGLVHFQMLPKADRDQFYLYVDMPAGTTVDTTRQFTEDVSNKVLSHPQVLSTQMFVAHAPVIDFNGLFKGALTRTEREQSTIRVNLTSVSERDMSSITIASTLRQQLADAFGTNASYIRVIEEPPGPPVQATLVAKFSTSDEADYAEAAAAFLPFVQTIPGVVDVRVDATEPVEQLQYVYQPLVAAANEVSYQEVENWITILTGQQAVGEYVRAASVERIPIHITTPVQYRQSPSTLDTVPMVTTTGATAPLGSVLESQYKVLPTPQTLEGAVPMTYVTAEVHARSIIYVIIETLFQLQQGAWSGYTLQNVDWFGVDIANEAGEQIRLDWGGEWKMTLENFRDLGLAMMVALFMVYAVLVAQYRSFQIPSFILLTVPFALIGILFGFLVLDRFFGIYLTATALIGFIALIGLVVNNAIIYLEYVAQEQRKGKVYTAALLAAGEARFRPILLTSLTTVLGSLTIASDPVWSGLAWSIVFGLSLSTLLTLVILPTFLLRFVRLQV